MYVANALGVPFAKNKKPVGVNLNGFTLLKSDDFERTPTNTVISAGGGTAGTIETDIITTDTGEIWNVVNGVWSRDADGIYLSGSGGRRAMYVETGAADCILEANIKWYDKAGFCFRYDGNAVTGKILFAVINNGGSYISMFDFDAWAETQLTSNANTVLVAGQTYHVKVILNGSSIKVELDGVEILSLTNTTNQTATKHGLHANTSNYSNRWNNIAITLPGSELSVIGDIWDAEYAEGKGTISTAQAKAGTMSLRAELNSTDANVSGSKRCELAMKAVEQAREEHIYMFSIYLPDGGEEDFALDPSSTENIAQWHQYADVGDFGGPAPLYLATRNGRYSLRINSCVDAVATLENITQNFFDLGSYVGDKGKWVDWAFHVRWGWLSEHKPLVEVYKNNKRIFRLAIPNTYNDQAGVYQKLGIYKWDWADTPENSILTKRVVYYDSVKDYIKSA